MKSFKKSAAILMLVSFIFATVSPAMAAGLAKITDIAGGNGGNALGNASTIYFGKYWQSYSGTGAEDAKESYNYEGIKWRVLSNAGGKTFLLSDQGLYADQFHSDGNTNTWASSEIRTTLNNRTDNGFAKDAFSVAEYGAIADTTLSDVSSSDKLFLLSAGEAKNTDYGFATDTSANDTRKATATEMAKNVLMYGNTQSVTVDSNNNSSWWLRTEGSGSSSSIVHQDGQIGDACLPSALFIAVRPALNLNQESVLFASAAEGGKGAVNVGDGFALDNTYDGADGWKLTLKDADIAAPTNVSVTQTTTDGVDDLAAAAGEGGTIDLTSGVTASYSAPIVKYTAQAITAGTANYVSAIVTDSTGANMLNYAKISGNADGSAGVSVGFGTLNNGTYKMYVYAEQANGNKETDYASAFSSADGYEFTKGSTTVNEGTLSNRNRNKNLTAKLGGGFNLSFESTTYKTAVTVGDDDNATITAHGSAGCSSLLRGKVTVGKGATLTTVNSFKFAVAGNEINEINGTLKGAPLQIAGGKTTVSSTGSIKNELTVIGDSTVLEAYAAGLKNNVTNNATVNLTGGTLDKKITGTGVTNINGDVTANAKIETAITVDESKKLTVSAGNLGGDVTNHGTVDLTGGTVAGEIVINGDNGTTNIKGKVENKGAIAQKEVTVAEGKTLTNKGTVQTGTLNVRNAKIINCADSAIGEVDIELNTINAEGGTIENAGDIEAVTFNGGTKGGKLINGETGEIEIDNFTGAVTMENKGKVKFVSSEGNSFNGTFINKGTLKVANKVDFTGTLDTKGGTLEFVLDGHKADDKFIVNDKTIDLADAEVEVEQEAPGSLLAKGEKMTLISKAKNFGEEEISVREGMKKYVYGIALEEIAEDAPVLMRTGLGENVAEEEDNTALMLTGLGESAADETKSFSEARLAGMAAINSASDLVAGQAIDSASSGDSWEAFAAISGSHNRYNTGSHVDLNGLNVAAGLSKKVKDNVTLGIFVEGGNGRYTTYNEFEDGDVRADGDINYFGGGVFAKVEGKKTAKGQLHGEASFRAGHMNSDYNSETFDEDELIRFDTSSAYLGIHAGLGYKWNVKDGSNVDTYVKYLWNRQNSDSPTISGEKFDFDAINSHRLRAGFRYNSKENDKGIKFYGGLAYEYEFDGVAKGHLGEYAILEPDYKGGSGIAEIGFKYHKANSPWKVDLGLTGATGKRDSIGISLGATYEFGK